MAVDDLTALVDLGGDAFHDRGGRKSALRVRLRVVEIARLLLAVSRGVEISEQGSQHGQFSTAPRGASIDLSLELAAGTCWHTFCYSDARLRQSDGRRL